MQSFLFTDIESSTRLWEEHPTTMPDALARHDRALGAAISGNRGRIVKTTGDGMIAVFDDAADALLAALVGQTALNSEAWAATGPTAENATASTSTSEKILNHFAFMNYISSS